MDAMRRCVGIILVAVSAAGFGTLAILGRYAYADGMDALTILSLRFSLAALVLTALLAARRERLPNGATLLRLIGMGAIGYVGQAFAYLTALKYASPGLVAMLLYLYPAFVVILSALWLREPIQRTKALALGLALTGLALTVRPEGGQTPGIVLAILAAAIYAVYIMVGAQVMQQVSAIQSATVIFAAAGTMASALMLAHGPQVPATGAGWAAIGAMVLLATVLPVVAFLAGLERIGATNAAMLSTLEPAVTVLLAAALLGETLKPITLVGGGLILAAVLLLTVSELRRVRSVCS
ncbi:MAG: DMT family transporter [Chloroflexi bacterium]|nr:DMT family transporter [Chloroflexota bacterium]